MRTASLPGSVAVLLVLCACDHGTPPAPAPLDTMPSAATSTLSLPAVATVAAGQVEVTVTARNATGDGLADIDVQLTAAPLVVAAVAANSARTDAAGTARFTLSLVSFGNVKLTADLGGGAARLEANIPVTCGAQERPTPSTMIPNNSFWTMVSATAEPSRALADGAAVARVVATAQFAWSAASPTFYEPIAGACFRVSVDRSDVLPVASHGSSGTDGAFDFLLTSRAVGPAVVTVESEYATKQVTVEFVATPGWSVLGTGADRPTDAADVALTPSGELLVAADGHVWRSADRGTTWSVAARAESGTAFEFDGTRVVPSVVAPGIVLALSSAGTLARSVDGGLTFSMLDTAPVTGLAVDPVADRYLAWRDGTLLSSSDHGTTWIVTTAPRSGAITYWPAAAAGDLAVQLDPTDWLANGWGMNAHSFLWTGSPWSQVAGFPPIRTPTWYELMLGAAADEFVLDDTDPRHVFVSVSELIKIGPGGYVRDRPCFESTDAAATWTPLTSCWPRGARVQVHGASGVYAATDHVLLHLVQGAFREVDVGLPQGARRLAFDSAHLATVFAATPAGVYVTTSSGE